MEEPNTQNGERKDTHTNNKSGQRSKGKVLSVFILPLAPRDWFMRVLKGVGDVGARTPF